MPAHFGPPTWPNDLPVGSVVEQRQGNRTVLIVQEARGKTSVVETWDDAFELTNRLLGRLKETLEEMNADMSTLNKSTDNRHS